MSSAKDVSAATYDFLLAQTGTLEKRDVLLACVAATAAAGASKQTREVLIYALQRGLPESQLREALLEVALFAGSVRAEQALAALGDAAVEAEKPTDPFAALLDPKERKVAPGSLSSPEDEQPEPRPTVEETTGLDSVQGERAAKIRARIAGRSRTLARRVEEDLSRRVFGRSGLTTLQRALVALGAVTPLDARDAVADWVHAARRAGATDESLWAVAEILGRLFRDTPELKNALSGFETILGRRVKPLDDD